MAQEGVKRSPYKVEDAKGSPSTTILDIPKERMGDLLRTLQKALYIWCSSANDDYEDLGSNLKQEKVFEDFSFEEDYEPKTALELAEENNKRVFKMLKYREEELQIYRKFVHNIVGGLQEEYSAFRESFCDMSGRLGEFEKGVGEGKEWMKRIIQRKERLIQIKEIKKDIREAEKLHKAKIQKLENKDPNDIDLEVKREHLENLEEYHNYITKKIETLHALQGFSVPELIERHPELIKLQQNKWLMEELGLQPNKNQNPSSIKPEKPSVKPYEPVGEDLKLTERIQGGADRMMVEKTNDGINSLCQSFSRINSEGKMNTNMTTYQTNLKVIQKLNPSEHIQVCEQISRDVFQLYQNRKNATLGFQSQLQHLESMKKKLAPFCNQKEVEIRKRFPNKNSLEYKQYYASLRMEFEHYKGMLFKKYKEISKVMAENNKTIQSLEPRIKELKKQYAQDNLLSLVRREYGNIQQYKLNITLPIKKDNEVFWFQVQGGVRSKKYKAIHKDELRDVRYKHYWYKPHEDEKDKVEEHLRGRFKDFEFPKNPKKEKPKRTYKKSARNSQKIDLTDDHEWRPSDSDSDC